MAFKSRRLLNLAGVNNITQEQVLRWATPVCSQEPSTQICSLHGLTEATAQSWAKDYIGGGRRIEMPVASVDEESTQSARIGDGFDGAMVERRQGEREKVHGSWLSNKKAGEERWQPGWCWLWGKLSESGPRLLDN
uniref:Uncharacterized protein n=1 Tax=Oryza barthii TaxID=65489 RepID=A0A0D3HFG1_9ORYZ